jgi:glycosyltransferase involved in cell wall biosynthesis
MVTVKKRLNVCHLISGDLWAGAEVMASQLIIGLHLNDNMYVSAIVFNKGRLADELKNAGIDVTIIEESKYIFPILVYKVYRALRTRKINILHSHRLKENILALLVATVLGKVKCITTKHGMPEFSYKKLSSGSIISSINIFILSRLFSCTVAVSDEIRTILINKHSFSEKRTVTIHNGIQLPPPDFSSIKNIIQPFTIGTAGRCVPVKDFGLFIAIADQLRDNKNFRFVLAGDGPLFIQLQKTVEKHHLENFTFLGHIEDMNSFYSQIDLFLNTSQHEGIPMTILEAMSRGIPVIAPHVGGIPEIITNGVDGFLIQKRDQDLYIEKCHTLATEPALYLSMSRIAHDKIENLFSDKTMVQRYSQLYRS